MRLIAKHGNRQTGRCRSGDSDEYVVQQLMYVPYGMYERVAVVTHVSDEKSIETEDGRRKTAS